MSEWGGETVLLTGGASFIGSHLAEDLVAEGASVRIADDFSSGTKANLRPIRDDIEILSGNLKRRAFADEATEGIDTVFHLAADRWSWLHLKLSSELCDEHGIRQYRV